MKLDTKIKQILLRLPTNARDAFSLLNMFLRYYTLTKAETVTFFNFLLEKYPKESGQSQADLLHFVQRILMCDDDDNEVSVVKFLKLSVNPIFTAKRRATSYAMSRILLNYFIPQQAQSEHEILHKVSKCAQFGNDTLVLLVVAYLRNSQDWQGYRASNLQFLQPVLEVIPWDKKLRSLFNHTMNKRELLAFKQLPIAQCIYGTSASPIVTA